MKKILSFLLVCVLLSTLALPVFSVEEVQVTLNGERIAFDVPGQIINGRSMVPMRKIFETLGATVEWIPAEQGIAATRGNQILILVIGSNLMLIADKATGTEQRITLDVPPQIVNDRTLVPVRAVSEGLGLNVAWDGATRTAMLTTPDYVAPAPETPAPETPVQEHVSAETRVAMIADYGAINDRSYNQMTNEACKAFCDANQIAYKYFMTASPTDEARVAAIEAAVAEKYNVLVLPGANFAKAVQATVGRFPQVKFIGLDMGEPELGSEYVVPANLYSVGYREEVGGFLAGYAAVKLGYTKLGYLGAMALPAVVRYGYGFVQGANAAAAVTGADVELYYGYGNQYFGDSVVTSMMDGWYASGVQVVFAYGGGIYTSAASAASKVGGKVICADTDLQSTLDFAYGSGITLTCATKGLSTAVRAALTSVVNGTFGGGRIENLGVVSANPEENYMQLSATTKFGAGFTKADYTALLADMAAGKVSVSADIENGVAVYATAITLKDFGNLK